MRGPENLEPLPPPDEKLWSSIDTVVDRELKGGHQSRVFAGERAGNPVVVKLVDSRLAGTAFHDRVAMAAVLSESYDGIVGPVADDGRLVAELDGWLAVTYPFVDGRPPGIDDEDDVRRMGTEMARLHRSLGELDPFDLPAVAALASTASGTNGSRFGAWQLLHGDFSRKNLLFSNGRVRVIDFDDCGYGPIEFDVGNTLYMELFDAFISSGPDRYEQFRLWFVDAYRAASNVAVADEALDDAIDLRVDALARWIEHPDTAPIGIRAAPPAWRETLRSFVQQRRRR